MKNKSIIFIICVLLLSISVISVSAASNTPDSSETGTEPNEYDTFVVELPIITTTTTESLYKIYESQYQEALVQQSILSSQIYAYNESVAQAEKGYDLSLHVDFLCSVKGDVHITLRNTDNGKTYPIILKPANDYYHYMEYPAGNYVLTDGYTSNPDCKVESTSFSLGRSEHIGVTIRVYDDDNEFS